MGYIKYNNASYKGSTAYYHGQEVEHGYGVLKFDNGTIYKGNFVNGEFEGQGEWTCKPNLDDDVSSIVREVGIFKKSRLYKGTKTFEDGATLEGEFDENGNVIGEAKYTYANGTIYVGPIIVRDNTYRRLYYPGKIKLYYKDGSLMYEGYFNKKQEFDFGVLHYQSGSYYDGSFKKRTFHGYGSYFWCIDKETNFYVELTGKFKKGSFYDCAFIFDGKNRKHIVNAKNIDEVCYQVGLKTIQNFVALPEDNSVYTKNHALMVRLTKELLKDRPLLMQAYIDRLDALYTYYAFERRMKYDKDQNFIYDFSINSRKDILMENVLYRALNFTEERICELADTLKEARQIQRQLDELALKNNYIRFYTARGNEVKPLEKKKKTLPKKDKPFVYQYNRNKRKDTEGLSIRFRLGLFGYQVTGSDKTIEGGKLVIPMFVGFKNIKGIKSKAFTSWNNIEVVDIPSLIKVEKHAFYECDSLKTIIISGDAQEFAPAAIERAVNLEEIIYYSTKRDWLAYHSQDEWLKYLDSKYIVTIHCSDGDLILEDDE